jgi:hypothetical protein
MRQSVLSSSKTFHTQDRCPPGFLSDALLAHQSPKFTNIQLIRFCSELIVAVFAERSSAWKAQTSANCSWRAGYGRPRMGDGTQD